MAAQPWSNGAVRTFGGAYLAATQRLPAREQPPLLRAMAPAVTFADMYEGCSYQGGAKVLPDLRWAAADIVPGEIRSRAARGETVPENGGRLDLDAVLNGLPLADDPLIGDVAPFYRDWLAHATADAYWRHGSAYAGYDRITVPALNIGGWYDIFLQSTFANFNGMRECGASEQARRFSRGIVGLWSHMNFSASSPEREFGPGAGSAAINLPGIQLRWFDHWLKGAGNGVQEEPPVTIFVMSVDHWRTGAAWPPPDTQYRPYYLHSASEANPLRDDGALSAAPPGDEDRTCNSLIRCARCPLLAAR